MRTEWIIEEAGKYGTCIATFNLECYDYNAITRQYKLAGHGSSVTVHFVYANPSAIVRTTAPAVSVYYDLHGFPLETEPAKGLYIRRTQCADGSFVTQKVMKP